MLKIFWSLFLTGIILGSGPCLFSCGPLLVSYIAATKDNAKSGLRTYLIFSFVRIFVYCFFGLLCGIFGEVVLHKFFESVVLEYLFFAFGVFLVFLGILLVIEKFPFGRCCHSFVCRYFGNRDIKSVVLFSLVVSFSPCLPLLAVLGYIVLITDYWFQGVVYMAVFGLGTVVSPLIVLSGTAGYVVQSLQKKENFLRFLRIVCGIIIFFLGARFIYVFIRSS
ncbi:MAG: sulfite exporter TauE/SafE family protein [Candidatus Omnitrophota bacterium]